MSLSERLQSVRRREVLKHLSTSSFFPQGTIEAMNENAKEISIKITDRHTSTVRSHHGLSNGLQS
jgi:hypothetical protein